MGPWWSEMTQVMRDPEQATGNLSTLKWLDQCKKLVVLELVRL